MHDIAIVTGGASGIGAALGRALVRQGTDVVLADIDEAGAAANAKLFADEGPGTAVDAPLDVRDPKAVIDLVHDVHATHGHLDYIFNNAGISLGGEPEELTLAHWDRIIDVNLRGVLYGCQAAYPLMKQQGHGHIVNTASQAGLTPVPGWLASYSMTKFAVVGLSLALRSAGADFGVRVTAVCPGWTDTPILDKLGPEDLPIPPSVTRAPSLRSMLAENHMSIYSPDRLATDILNGMRKNKAVIAAPRTTRAQWWFWRLAPEMWLRYMARLTRYYHDLTQPDSSE